MVAIRLTAFWVALSLGIGSAIAAPMDESVSPFEDLYARNNGLHSYTGPYAQPGAWADGFAKAQTLIDQMTIEEKVNVTTGFTGKCVGYTGEVPRLGLNALCLQDGPLGVRPARRVSQFPAGVTTAATWDRDLIAKRAEAIANEFKDKGVNIWLGPVTGGPLGRAPRMGRNWEGWSPDEYLSGEASYLTVKHAQEVGVMACSKHYIAYEQETYRNPYIIALSSPPFAPLEQEPISSNLDDRTSHELYMWSFAEAVRAGTGSIMCSYNEVNNTHACQDDHSLNELLKRELNFNGAVISDWGGTWTNKESALGGLDVSMPGSLVNEQGIALFGDFFGDNLINLVKAGKVPEKRLDDMVLRILGPALHLQDLDTYPKPSFDVRDLTLRTNNVRRDHHKLIKQIGEESLTLVKNKNKHGRGLPLPPLAEMQGLAVIGQDAGPGQVGWTTCGETGQCKQDANNGTLTSGGGSGWAFPPYIIDPLAAIQDYVRAEGPDINYAIDNWDLQSIAFQANHSDTALVFVNAYATEGGDRLNLTLWGNGEEVIRTAARNNNNTVVIIHSPGPVDMNNWVHHENVTAVLYAYYPGQESGSSLPAVLWGEKSPSGKLPFTVARKESDFPPHTISKAVVKDPQADFDEKLLIDYKWFDAKDISPLFEFGHGLTYTNFSYASELRVEKTFEADSTSIQRTAEKFSAPASASFEGDSIYDTVLKLSVDVTNTGSVAASEVAQLYVTMPKSAKSPPRLLRGFTKLPLQPGETKTATFSLRKKDIAIWDTPSQSWKVPEGTIKFSAGASSRKLFAFAEMTF